MKLGLGDGSRRRMSNVQDRRPNNIFVSGCCYRVMLSLQIEDEIVLSSKHHTLDPARIKRPFKRSSPWLAGIAMWYRCLNIQRAERLVEVPLSAHSSVVPKSFK